MKYFTIEEFIGSDAAKRANIPNNIPSQRIADNIVALIEQILDPARAEYGKEIRVSSGYRCPRLNKILGGSLTSQHCKGEAVDLICADMATLFRILRDRGGFDQLIWEFGNDKAPNWIHVSYRRIGKNRGEVLKAVCRDGKTNYLHY